jgi:hypothetical protein
MSKMPVESAVSAKVRAVLLKDARGAAKGAKGVWSAEAVRTTHGEAEALEGSSEGVGGIPAQTPVYFIAMRGHFRHVCHSYPGCPPSRIVEFEVSTESPGAILTGVYETSDPAYPNLRKLGVPVVLARNAKGIRLLRRRLRE